jgi:arsenate reductase (thioredoxin)
MGRAAADPNPTARVLFLCTGNSCRSQMAEGFARSLLGDHFAAFSAGTRPSPHGIDPRAVAAMAELGIDISGGHSKSIDELPSVPFDLVVTVCDSAHENCPIFPGAVRVIHHSFDDPPRLAAHARNDAEAMPHYRRVRDEIKVFIATLPALNAHTH